MLVKNNQTPYIRQAPQFLLPMPLLNALGISATAAYGLRLLKLSHRGPCLNVRRSVDNKQLDLYFTGHSLDVGTAYLFAQSGQLFVTKWYDQSGNGNDASQATAASQPQLVLNATPSGKPALKSVGTTTNLVTGAAIALSQPLTYAILANITAAPGFQVLGVSASGANGPSIYWKNSTAQFGSSSTNNDAASALRISGAASIWETVLAGFNGASSFITANGTTVFGTMGTNAMSGTFWMFQDSVGDATVSGTLIEEMIVFLAALSPAQQALYHANLQAFAGVP